MEEDNEKAPEEEANSEDKEDLESEQPQEEDDSEESNEDSEDKDDREMHKATCSECGKECEVPFKPESGRDVFCEDCFRKRRKPRRSFGGGNRGGFGGGNRGGFGGGNRGGGFRREREMHDAVCAECGKKCQVPFKPSGDKPVLCKDCYMKAR